MDVARRLPCSFFWDNDFVKGQYGGVVGVARCAYRLACFLTLGLESWQDEVSSQSFFNSDTGKRGEKEREIKSLRGSAGLIKISSSKKGGFLSIIMRIFSSFELLLPLCIFTQPPLLQTTLLNML